MVLLTKTIRNKNYGEYLNYLYNSSGTVTAQELKEALELATSEDEDFLKVLHAYFKSRPKPRGVFAGSIESWHKEVQNSIATRLTELGVEHNLATYALEEITVIQTTPPRKHLKPNAQERPLSLAGKPHTLTAGGHSCDHGHRCDAAHLRNEKGEDVGAISVWMTKNNITSLMLRGEAA